MSNELKTRRANADHRPHKDECVDPSWQPIQIFPHIGPLPSNLTRMTFTPRIAQSKTRDCEPTFGRNT